MKISWPKQESTKNFMNRVLRKWRNIQTSMQASQLDSWGMVKHLRFSENKTALMILPNADLGLSRQLYYDSLREWRSTQVFIRLLKKRDYEKIIDVGANLGYFVTIERLYSEAEILAIEPVHFNFQILNLNILLNQFNKTSCENCAVGDSSGVTTIYEFEHKNWSTVDPEHAANLKMQGYSCKERTIEKKVLSDYFKESESDKRVLIRMDVEGYEFEILKNADFLSKQSVDIFVEFHSNLLGQKKSLVLLKKFKDYGYEKAIVVFNEEFGPKSQLLPYSDQGRVLETTVEDTINSISKLNGAFLEAHDGFELFLIKE